jgi:hypothetical protein
MSMNPLAINEAFAHETLYPHIHPHASSSFAVDLLFTLLWFAGIAFLVLLLLRVTRQMIHSLLRKR